MNFKEKILKMKNTLQNWKRSSFLKRESVETHIRCQYIEVIIIVFSFLLVMAFYVFHTTLDRNCSVRSVRRVSSQLTAHHSSCIS